MKIDISWQNQTLRGKITFRTNRMMTFRASYDFTFILYAIFLSFYVAFWTLLSNLMYSIKINFERSKNLYIQIRPFQASSWSKSPLWLLSFWTQHSDVTRSLYSSNNLSFAMYGIFLSFQPLLWRKLLNLTCSVKIKFDRSNNLE